MHVPADVLLQDANSEEDEDESGEASSSQTIHEGLAETECVKHDEAYNPAYDGVSGGIEEGENEKGGQETHHEPAKGHVAITNYLDNGVEQPCPNQQQDDDGCLYQALGVPHRS
jgi:hypothetical protein